MGKETKLTMKTARVNAGLTQQEVAERIGVSRKTVINWEQGRVAPAIPQYQLFALICGVSVDAIILPF